MNTAGAESLPAVTGNIGNSPHARAGSESYPSYRQLPATAGDEETLTLTFPPELVERIAARAAELVAERLEPDADRWLNVEEAAAYIGAPPSRIYSLASCKPPRIPVERDGSRLLFKQSELDGWVRGGGGKRP